LLQVDLSLAGQEDNYGRMYDVAPHFNETSPWISGFSAGVTTSPPATTYIATGDAGNDKNHEAFQKPQPNRTAFWTNAHGCSRMAIHSASHIHWQQAQCDESEEPVLEGVAVGGFWLFMDHHGTFADRRWVFVLLGLFLALALVCNLIKARSGVG
jgi:hypothetical protein